MISKFRKRPKTIPQLAYHSKPYTLEQLDRYAKEDVYDALVDLVIFEGPLRLGTRYRLFLKSHTAAPLSLKCKWRN